MENEKKQLPEQEADKIVGGTDESPVTGLPLRKPAPVPELNFDPATIQDPAQIEILPDDFPGLEVFR